MAKHTAYKEKFEVEAEEAQLPTIFDHSLGVSSMAVRKKAWQKMVEKAREERAIKIKYWPEMTLWHLRCDAKCAARHGQQVH